MEEIKCPKCGTIFTIDEANYDSIIKQIRDHEFDKELEDRMKLLQESSNTNLKLKTQELESIHKEELRKKEEELLKLRMEKESVEKNQENELMNVKRNTEKEYLDEVNNMKLKIKELENTIKLKDQEKESEILKITSKKDQDIQELKNKMEIQEKEFEIDKKNTKEKYEIELQGKEKTIEFYKDMKLKQSTKMLGETLEQHCNAEFAKVRPMFSNTTYFEKDNDSHTGSKGDFIFREEDEEGNEIVSIMFEMKNEADETASKHKNEDFFKELDKDRKEKKCEYAVLVSLLERDSELYNSGIVDVSYRYEKMYVIRPQFFIPIITLLRNASLKSLDYKKQLNHIKNQNIDITNFENNINVFKDSFYKHYKNASERFEDAIKEIDKTISNLTKVRENLVKSESHLDKANKKLDDLSIKKLVKGNKTMAEKFGKEMNNKELLDYAESIQEEEKEEVEEKKEEIQEDENLLDL
ncbi:MAG: DUF2130 domain-containing protein [Bacilli bacterium]|nr:DUF2130 domain-containing protein [Bacilli bacterium]